jgi:hypothetical protein
MMLSVIFRVSKIIAFEFELTVGQITSEYSSDIKFKCKFSNIITIFVMGQHNHAKLSPVSISWELHEILNIGRERPAPYALCCVSACTKTYDTLTAVQVYSVNATDE